MLLVLVALHSPVETSSGKQPLGAITKCASLELDIATLEAVVARLSDVRSQGWDIHSIHFRDRAEVF